MPNAEEIETHPAALPLEELLVQCEMERTRRGGPGGQHRNKTETAIVLTHRPTGVSGQASERRSQKDNREMALFRLRMNLALAIRLKVAVEDESAIPSDLWQSRVIGNKLQVSSSHSDFPALIAESLDWIAGCDFDLSGVAKRLKLSTSQLVKFLKHSPEAWQLVQRKRHELGLPRLK